METSRQEGSPVTSNTPAQAGRREWIGMAVLALACVLYAMDLTVLHLAVPSLSAELKPTSAAMLIASRALMGVAGQLPNELELALLAIAQEAFVQGLHLAAAISAIVAIGAAIMAVVFLRHVPIRTQAERQAEADAYAAAIVELAELEAEHAA